MCVNFLSCSSCSQFASLFPGLTTEEEVLKVLCILDTNTFQVEEKKHPLFYISFVLHLLVMSRFWLQVAPPPSPVSFQGLLCSTTAVPQTVASFSGFSSSCDKLFSYFIHQV